MPTVLSTKILAPNQKNLLLNSGLSLVEYDAIRITFLAFEIPSKIENAIFTSKNAVNSFFECQSEHSRRPIQNCYCVGERTKELLKENGQNVVKMKQNASELAHFIQKNYENETFYFFCGTLRREEIPSLQKNSKNRIIEVETYKIELNNKRFTQIFDGILFFSPSGVQSFIEVNKAEQTTAICIGETTAAEAKKHFSEVIAANATTIESTIAKAVKTLKVNSMSPRAQSRGL